MSVAGFGYSRRKMQMAAQDRAGSKILINEWYLMDRKCQGIGQVIHMEP